MAVRRVQNLRQLQNAAAERLDSACRAAGVPVTLQRRAVYAALVGRSDHPTADALYAEIAQRPETSQMSRTTVYRVLETLVTLGLARRADHVGSAVRYDPYISHHHHLVCVGCDRVVDWEPVFSDNSAVSAPPSAVASGETPALASGETPALASGETSAGASADAVARREGVRLPNPKQTGFVVSDYSIIFRGWCRQCRPERKSAKPTQAPPALAQLNPRTPHKPHSLSSRSRSATQDRKGK